MSPEKPRRLGRGLEALIPGSASSPRQSSELQSLALARIHPNPFQPRREFDPAELAELEASLKASGLLQPITVRARGDGYELIAGERRLRAATNLGWAEISAIVREFDDQSMLVLALVENLQRASLNAIDEARGYRRLIEEFKLTQQQVGDAVGKDRTTITNLLRVLTLPAAVQGLVETGALSTGHARALLALGAHQPIADLANQAVAGGLSVRELEQIVRDLSGSNTPATDKKSEKTRAKVGASDVADPAARRIVDDLRRYFQTDVRMHVARAGEFSGRLEISFYSNDDLDRILDLILRESRRDY